MVTDLEPNTDSHLQILS